MRPVLSNIAPVISLQEERVSLVAMKLLSLPMEWRQVRRTAYEPDGNDVQLE